MIAFFIGLLLGALAGVFIPERARAWVRGRLAAVAVFIGGRLQPRRETVSRETARETVRALAPKNPMRLGAILMSLARNWRLIGVLIVAGLIFWGLTLWDGPFGLGKSRGELALERRLADAEAEMQRIVNERDAEIARAATQAAVHRAQIALLSERGRDEIEAARPVDETPLDPELVRAWRGAIERLRDNAGADPARPDPGGAGAAG